MRPRIAVFLSFILVLGGLSISFYGEDEATAVNIIEEGNYCKILSNDGIYLYKEGYPLLPYKVKTYTFPLGTKIRRIEVKVEGIEKMKLNKKIAFTEDKERVHELKDFYPENWFSYKARVGIKNGEHVIFLSLHLYPVRYNASRNEILYVRNFDIKVEYEVAPESLFSKDEYDLLVIAPDKWVKDLEPLKTHEEREGIKTIVVGLSEIYSSKYFPTNGRDDAEKLKYFIKNAIEQWGIEYVLLGGDDEIIPHRGLTVESVTMTDYDIPSDLYYACLDGNYNSKSGTVFHELVDAGYITNLSENPIIEDGVGVFGLDYYHEIEPLLYALNELYTKILELKKSGKIKTADEPTFLLECLACHKHMDQSTRLIQQANRITCDGYNTTVRAVSAEFLIPILPASAG